MDNWKNIFDENILRPNVNFAAMFVLNYECLKDYIVNQIRDFYAEDIQFKGDEMVCRESKTYQKDVRELDKNIENASLKWFIEMEAITQEDYDTYQKIRKKRNDIIHELLKNLSDGFTEYDIELFAKMISIYDKIDKWWINEIEIPISGEDIPDDYDRNAVCGGQAIILSIINSIILENKGDEYKELFEEMSKIWNSSH